MRERAINLRDHEVRALLAGATQMRRAVKMPPTADFIEPVGMIAGPDGEFYESDDGGPVFVANRKDRSRVVHPPARIGDVLWGRECWGLVMYTDPTDWHRWSIRDADDRILGHWRTEYRATYGSNQETCFWRPSTQMPRWASRLSLRVTSVRVERLQDVTEEDAVAMGARRFDNIPDVSTHGTGARWSMFVPTSTAQCLGTARMAVANAWNREHGADGWQANPWVWALGVERIGGGAGCAVRLQ